MICAVLATGPSMSQAVADSVRGRCKVIAVSDAYLLAPWADALVSTDANWWRVKRPEFAGPKFSVGRVDEVEMLREVPHGTNSGLLGVRVAVEQFKATKVLLFGVDLYGTHFFGPHTGRLRNAAPSRIQEFHYQFSSYQPRGVQIYNCNPKSKLKCYPMARLEDHLESLVEPETPDSGADRSLQGRIEAAGLHGRTGLHAQARRSRYLCGLEQNQGGGVGG